MELQVVTARPGPATSHVAEPKTQLEVAQLLGISRTRVYQIEHRALRKIRAAFAAEARTAGLSVPEWLGGEG